MKYILATIILVLCLSTNTIAQHHGQHGHKTPPCPNPYAHRIQPPYVYPPIIVPRQNFGFGPYGVAPYNPYPYPYYNYYQYQYQYRGNNFNFQFRF